MRHPKAEEQIRRSIDHYLAGAVQAPEDLVELAASAKEIGWSVEELRDARAAYAPDNDDEWREQVTSGLIFDILAVAKMPGPRHWSRWPVTSWMASKLYVLGVLASRGLSYDWSGRRTIMVIFAGQRNKYTGKRHRPVYVAGWPVRKWRCLLKYHHWPSDEVVAFDLCRKCLPCPECGQAAPLYHECEVDQ